MCLTKEWQHMVLTHRIEINILDNHHLAVIFTEHGAFNHALWIDMVSLSQKLHGFGHSHGCIYKAFAFGLGIERTVAWWEANREGYDQPPV